MEVQVSLQISVVNCYVILLLISQCFGVAVFDSEWSAAFKVFFNLETINFSTLKIVLLKLGSRGILWNYISCFWNLFLQRPEFTFLDQWQKVAKSPWCWGSLSLLVSNFHVFCCPTPLPLSSVCLPGHLPATCAGPLWHCHLSSCRDFHLGLANAFPSYLVPLGCLNLHCLLVRLCLSSSHTLIDWSNF
jgi:hypothetical protein